MLERHVPPLPPGCPWSDWAPPTIKWWEDNLCGWITTPANTWSNLAYLVVGLLIWHEARRRGRADLALFGPATIFLGAASFLFHASYTFFFQTFDYLGMFLIISLVAALNGCRTGHLRVPSIALFMPAATAIFGILFYVFLKLGIPVQLVIVCLVLVLMVQEFTLARAPGTAASYRHFALGVAFLLGGTTFTILDLMGALFPPDNHVVQGHAIWHLLTATSIFHMYRFYTQFTPDDSGRLSLPAAGA